MARVAETKPEMKPLRLGEYTRAARARVDLIDDGIEAPDPPPLEAPESEEVALGDGTRAAEVRRDSLSSQCFK